MGEQETRFNPEEEQIQVVLSHSPFTKVLLNKTLRQTGKDVWWSQFYNQDQRFRENFPPHLEQYRINTISKFCEKGRQENILIANDYYNRWGIYWSMGIGFETREPNLFLPPLESLLKEFNIIKEKGNPEQSRTFIRNCVQFGINFRYNLDEDKNGGTRVVDIPEVFKDVIRKALEGFE
jgi:hypothetical protein